MFQCLGQALKFSDSSGFGLFGATTACQTLDSSGSGLFGTTTACQTPDSSGFELFGTTTAFFLKYAVVVEKSFNPEE